MRIKTILVIGSLMMFPIIGLAQTPNSEVSNSAAGTGLNVSLAPNNPTASVLNYPRTDTTSQAIVLSTRFTAGSGGGFTISELRFRKNGELLDSSILMAYLVEIDAPLFKSNTITNGVIEFKNISFNITAGQTRTLLLVIDTPRDLPVGTTASFSLNTADDITALDALGSIVVASGSFPVIGNIFTATPISNFPLTRTAQQSATVSGSESSKILEPAIPEKSVQGQGLIQSSTPKPVLKPTTDSVSIPTTAATTPNTKCGLNTYTVQNECGAGVYKNVYAQCYDGFEFTLGETSSCKPADLWNQYAKERCENHCSKEGGNRYTPLGPSSVPIVAQEWVSVCTTIDRLNQNYNETVLELQKQEALSSKGKIESLTQSLETQNKYIVAVKKACADPQTAWQVGAPPKETDNISIYTQGSKPVNTITKPVEKPKATPVCYVSDDLMQKYNQLIIELQKSESDKTKAEEITKQIIELKQQISTQQKTCINTPLQQTSRIIQPASTAPQLLIENKPIAVAIDRCNEVAQWETKIVYYKKLGNLSDDELKKNGFSREEIEKILKELSLGIEKVKAQCTGQEKTPVVSRPTAITGSASITETVQPVVIESGQEINTYYKARLEKAVSAKGEEKQIQELKTLRDEIDGLISNLIKSRKELEVSELNSLVKEVTVSRGEIKVDDISVKTTEKKMLFNMGDRPVSVEPTKNQVLIRDKGLEVNASEVVIKENVLSVGGVNVNMSASEVIEKLGLVPTTIELKEENSKAVYNITIDEQRKLFGFISFNSQKTITADAENGSALSEQLPWYNFLTTK